MKKLSILILVLSTGCSVVHFDSAMPRHGGSLKDFSPDQIGKYYYCDSILTVEKEEPLYNSKYFSGLYKIRDSISLISADLTISQKLVYYKLNFKSYYKIAKVDTSRIVLKHRREKKTIEGNYLIFESAETDTILNLYKQDLLKYYQGSYYFNHFIGQKNWEVFQFEIKKDNLFSINMTNEQDEKQVKNNISESYPTLHTLVHLSNKMFEDFIQKGGFRTKYGLRKYPR